MKQMFDNKEGGVKLHVQCVQLPNQHMPEIMVHVLALKTVMAGQTVPILELVDAGLRTNTVASTEREKNA
ncbi:hypothetical protein NECAME_11822 [Necator americanus]|uniref:Uncharacterized protein n=1 Tax=Necator americanus TaxID=51031 RepID=W2T2J6_NECAM|nr:hypothetical protein NECAME_11822 [Necator americanus]ETN76230.1 hypothetical protein NECAME_11822 [Necator americanus]